MKLDTRTVFALFIALVSFVPQLLLGQQIREELMQKPWKAQWITGPGRPINRFTASFDLSLWETNRSGSCPG